MRVLIVSSHGADRTFGGAERYVHDLLSGLEARGHEISLLSVFPVDETSAAPTWTLHRTDWREDRVRRYRNHVGDWVAAPWPRLHELLASARPDIVHTNNLIGLGTGIWERARRLGIPVVHTLHDYHLLCPRTTLTRRDGRPCDPSPLLCGLRTRRLARWGGGVEVVIGVSEHVLRRHDTFFGPSSAMNVIRPPLAPLAGLVGSTPERPAVIGFLGGLVKAKGIEVLLEAAPSLAGLGMRLRVGGDGPLRREVELAPDVAYEGRLEGRELTAFLSTCDLGVVPSLWEEPALTFVVCEWLAAGRPVLTTGRGGLAEAAALGGAATFDGSSEGLLGALERLREEPEWRRLRDSVPPVHDDRDVERWLDEHEAAYEHALSGRMSTAAR